MMHPSSETSYFFAWLAYPHGYRSVVGSDRHFDDSIVALRGLDRARTTLHTPYTPDDGVTFVARTMDVGETTTVYDARILEQEGWFSASFYLQS